MAKFRGGKKTDGRVCSDCGGDLSEFHEGREVRHCAGISYAFGARKWGEPHHCFVLHARCWCCHEPLGCLLCSGIAQELLCENKKAHGDRGAVWATKKALLEHGPLIRQRDGRAQTLLDYPPHWAQEYEPMEVTSEAAAKILNELIAKIGKPIPT